MTTPASLDARARAASGRGLLATAARAVGSFFVEPVDARSAHEPVPSGHRPVIAVFGLTAASGATVVARGLAAELAVRDPAGAAAVSCEGRPAGLPLATPAALRLARALADVPGAAPRAVGRLCLVAGAEPLALADCASCFAPLVIDAGSAALGGAPASVAARTIVVTTPATEPALARVASACVARAGPEPIVVVNRAAQANEFPAGLPPPPLLLPDSRMGAQLALAGREARGELGRAIALLADLCEEER